jgi:hypothetical protein
MTKRKTFLYMLLAASSLLFPAPGSAADFSKVDLNAWLRIRFTRYDVGLTSLGGPRENLDDGSILITKGGGAFLEASNRSNPLGAPEPFGTLIMRGVGTAAERSKLAAAVQKAQLGIRQDCFSLRGDNLTWVHDVIWYGRGSRRQQFRVVFQSEPNETLPECPKVVVDLIFAVDAFLAAVRNHPTTEELSTPPR